MLEIAKTITETPPAVVAVNKRYVYAALEARGGRSVIGRRRPPGRAAPRRAGGDVAGLMQQVKAGRKQGRP